MAAGSFGDGCPWNMTPPHNVGWLEGGTSIQKLPAALFSVCLSLPLALTPSPGHGPAPKYSALLRYLSASSYSWFPGPPPLLSPPPSSPPHYLPPRMYLLHHTQGLQPPLCISILQVFSSGHVALFLLTSTGDVACFHHRRGRGVDPGGYGVQGSAGESKAQV